MAIVRQGPPITGASKTQIVIIADSWLSIDDVLDL